jgi:PAS domain S-box-containing protein
MRYDAPRRVSYGGSDGMIENGTCPAEPLSPASPARPADRQDARARDRSRALKVEQVRLLCASAPAALAATAVCVATLAAVEWNASPRVPLLFWLAYMGVLTALRYLMVLQFRRSPPEEQARPRWAMLFLGGAALAGLGWGSTMLLLLPATSVPHQLFLVFMLGGITAGAVSTLSARLDAFLCFALPVVAPIIAYFLMSGDTLTTAMAAMIIVFTVVMTYVASQVNSNLVSSLNLTLQNTNLLEHIRSQRMQLEQAEQARTLSDQRYQFFVDQATDIIYRTDRTGRFTFINAVAARILRCSDAEILGRHFTEFIRPDYRQAAQRAYVRQFARQTPTTYFEFPALTKDGRELWVGQNVQVLTENGQVTGFQAVARDITERKRAEIASHASEARYRALYDNNPCMYFTVDAAGIVLSVNRFGAQYLGYAPDELINGPVSAVVHAEDRDTVDRQLEACFRQPDQLAHCEFRKIRKDGSMLWVKETMRGAPDADGRPVVFIVCEDITERKRVEQALHASEGALRQALQERERLARNLHDNIIQSIYAIGFTLEECQELLRDAPEDADRKLDQVIAELNRIIREVRVYLTTPAEESEKLSADELIASLQRLGSMMEHANGMRFSFAIDRDAADRLTAGQRAQFLYVAQEAMSNSLRHSGSSTARVSLACTAGGIRLEVSDSGIGFALPGIRNGTGGLKNIRMRARKIGANFDIMSRPLGGTIVSMEIPTNEHHDLTWKA